MYTLVKLLSSSCLLWLLCGCVEKIPPTIESLVLDESKATEIDDLVLTKRVVLERAQKNVFAYGVDNYKEATATSEFGKEDEIANVDCIVSGVHKELQSSNIISPAEFWDAIGNDIDSISLKSLFDKKYSQSLNGLDIDYLIIAYHQLIDVEMRFHEDIIHGAYLDYDKEVAATVTLEIRNERIIDATEIDAFHDTMIIHILFVPLGGGTFPDEKPCVVAGRHAAKAISQSLSTKIEPRIAVVIAKSNPYSVLSTPKQATKPPPNPP